ncbi:N-acetyltransferase [Glutamicibacter soli]|uniref:N-acetyltransferase n=1 Tax=Glutamicibacter soli TaxID=453836 RepID=A0A365YMN9_9MICC|nr:GNAT family protein [Glutamicibacter soli]RBM03985.1 N-acetyltransferase [Glutamicibacter soli]
MCITFVQMSASDADDLLTFLTANQFPFHVQQTLREEDVRARIGSSYYWNEDRQGYWVRQGEQRLGMVVLEDLQDAESPLFDLRLAESCRGQGIGVKVLRALCDLVFESMPKTLRFEGQTREDNIAMRKTFIRSGFLKEAHYRMGWPTTDGRPMASIAYSILRDDWSSGTVTRFEWEDIEP